MLWNQIWKWREDLLWPLLESMDLEPKTASNHRRWRKLSPHHPRYWLGKTCEKSCHWSSKEPWLHLCYWQDSQTNSEEIDLRAIKGNWNWRDCFSRQRWHQGRARLEIVPNHQSSNEGIWCIQANSFDTRGAGRRGSWKTCCWKKIPMAYQVWNQQKWTIT